MVAAWKPNFDAFSHTRIALYPKERDFLLSDKYVRAFVAGRGSGKSTVGALDIIARSQPGGLYLVIAPTYTILGDVTMRSFIDIAMKLGVWDPKQFWVTPRPKCRLRNGAEFLFRSAEDPESLRGGDKAGAWCDELQNSDEDALRIIEPALRQWGKRGFLTGTFTPGAPDHWTSRTFINPVNPHDVACFRASMRENIFLDPSVYQSLLESWAASPLRIRRELEGECLFIDGAEWDQSYFDNVGFDSWPMTDKGIRVVVLDPSKGRGDKESDYSAFAMLWFVDGGTIFVDADLRNDRGDPEICQTGVEIFKQFNPHYFAIENESHQNDHLIRDMHKIADEQGLLMPICECNSQIIPGAKTKVDKKSRIRGLAGYISGRWFRYRNNSPGARLLRDQLMGFPTGEHDDGPDALAHGIYLLQKVTRGFVTPPRSYGVTCMGQINAPWRDAPREIAA